MLDTASSRPVKKSDEKPLSISMVFSMVSNRRRLVGQGVEEYQLVNKYNGQIL
jgi:hypothetical protein